jgi:hypothetical protein
MILSYIFVTLINETIMGILQILEVLYNWESHIDTDTDIYGDTVDINEIEEFVNKFYITNKSWVINYTS